MKTNIRVKYGKSTFISNDMVQLIYKKKCRKKIVYYYLGHLFNLSFHIIILIFYKTFSLFSYCFLLFSYLAPERQSYSHFPASVNVFIIRNLISLCSSFFKINCIICLLPQNQYPAGCGLGWFCTLYAQ